MALTQINPALFAGATNTTAVIQSNGTTAITVDSSQNVGIGTSSPAAKLDVSTSTSYGGIKINGANGASVNLYQPQSNASARNYQLLTNWEAWGTLDFQRSVDNATAPSVTLMSLNNAGTVVLKGGAVSNSGVGIAFPATQVASSDANTLDDYEEGSWTPNVISGSNNSTWASKSGRYIKVGGIVTCWFVCDAGNSGTAGTFLRVTGLPFTPVTIPDGCSTGIWGTNSTTPQVTGNIFNNGGTQAFFYGGNQITTQASYASGMFTYQAA